MTEVSVIIPTYNRAHLIRKAIQSVLNQTYPDFEIIVADDGSTDNTENEVKNFNSNKIRYIRHNENKGAAAARNTGIKLARGEYIAFQDSDDEWFPDKLYRQMEVFKNASPRVGVVYTGVWMVRDKERAYLPLPRMKQREGCIYKELLKENFIGIPTPAALVRKECFDKAGLFEEGLSRLMDWELWLRVSRYYEFKYIPEPLVTLYYTPDSISANPDAYIQARQLILEKHFEEFRRNEKLLAGHFFYIGVGLCLNGRPREARGYFLKSLKIFSFNPKLFLAILISLAGPGLCLTAIKLYMQVKKKLKMSGRYENRH